VTLTNDSEVIRVGSGEGEVVLPVGPGREQAAPATNINAREKTATNLIMFSVPLFGLPIGDCRLAGKMSPEVSVAIADGLAKGKQAIRWLLSYLPAS
jgi:hypothetical protein